MNNCAENIDKDNFSGYFSKRSLSDNSRSSERYFNIIEGQFLAYFRSKKERLLKGIFDLDLLTNILPIGVNR